MAVMTRVPISVQRQRPVAVLNSSPILKSECFMLSNHCLRALGVRPLVDLTLRSKFPVCFIALIIFTFHIIKNIKYFVFRI